MIVKEFLRMETTNQRTPHFKPVEELTFTDDYMFGYVMRNPEICKELLERLLKIKIERLEYTELQKSISPYYESKGIRLDVFVKDSNKIIDLEMQTTIPPALEKRVRYYQSVMDISELEKGKGYDEVKDSFVVFLYKVEMNPIRSLQE